MFYRRKIILALIQAFDGRIEKIALQKLLFLFTNRQQKPDYDFVPYHYGCYSFSANADLTAMAKHGLLGEDKSSFTKLDNVNYITKLTEVDKKLLVEVKSNYGKLSSNSLMKFTYLNYQYYAINSKKAIDILSEEQYQKVVAAKPKSDSVVLFTIGYEGISLEEYLNKLIKNNIKLLVDVRNNPLSMKYGFSKSQLSKFCEGLGIEYIHIPEVGIQSEFRQALKSQDDYDNLFKMYTLNTLVKTNAAQKRILDLLEDRKRIALTCFEANICQCHRKHLAESIITLPQWNYELKHI